VEDLAEDGVVYAEIRYAPELFQNDTMDCDMIVQAINEGFAQGMKIVNENNAFSLAEKAASLPSDEAESIDLSAAKYRYPVKVRSLLCAMRQHSNAVAEKIANLTIKYRDECIAGFDIAGPENGFPPRRHASAFDKLRRENMHFTIHAGEDFGLPSIWEAIQICGSDRLGHGVRLIDDIFDGATDLPITMSEIPISPSHDDLKKLKLGRLANYIRNRRITLEVCPTSNLQTGCVPSSSLRGYLAQSCSMVSCFIVVCFDRASYSPATFASLSRDCQHRQPSHEWHNYDS
jgi:adenosine deaminase